MSEQTGAAQSVGHLLEQAVLQLRAAGVESAQLDAQVLASFAFHLDRTVLLAHPERTVPPNEMAQFDRAVRRRVAHEPTAYVVGHREFYGREYLTDRRALIPRPETEGLVEAARRLLCGLPRNPFIIDIGTGCGCLGITLALELCARVVAVDLSANALALARENARRLAVPYSRFMLVQGDLLTWLRSDAPPPDLIVANLPYVPAERLDTLAPEIRLYEPRLALDGGPGGTRLLARLLRDCASRAVPALLAEVDEEHASSMIDLARSLGVWGSVSVEPDLAGLPRVLVAHKNEAAG